MRMAVWFALPLKERFEAYFVEKSVLFYWWGFLQHIVIAVIIQRLPWRKIALEGNCLRGEHVHTLRVLKLVALMKSLRYSSIQDLFPILRSLDFLNCSLRFITGSARPG